MIEKKEISLVLIIFICCWLFYNCNKSIGHQTKKEAFDSSVVRNEILVQLKPEIRIDSFLNSFNGFNLTIKKEISKRMYIWLLTFDEKKIKPEKMISSIKKHSSIKSAEFNRKVNLIEEK